MGNAPTTRDSSSSTTGRVSAAASMTAGKRTGVTAVTDVLTKRSLSTWSAGDYDRIAAGFRGEAEAFIDRLELAPGQRVLDTACGSGNLTIPAARTGARVTGFDLIPGMLAAAAAWAAREGLDIEFDQGSAEELPYGDASFDVVTSMFGMMFAARPERVAAELTRVTRHGGRLALATWPREGFIGQMLARHMAYSKATSTVPSPLLWADESVIRERLAERDWEVTVTPRTLTFRYPHSPAGTAQLFCTSYGPTVRLMESLDERQQALFTRDLTEHWSSRQRGSAAETIVDAEYVEVVAARR